MKFQLLPASTVLLLASAASAVPLFSRFETAPDSPQHRLSSFWPHFPGFHPKPDINTTALQELVTAAELEERANTLYEIANSSVAEYGNPTRVIGSPGHLGTIDYILAELGKLSKYYTFYTQDFEALDGKVKSFSLLVDGVEPKSVTALGFTPPTKDKRPVHGDLVLVKNFGCELSDFPAAANNSIVLIQRGVCPFGDKSLNAGKAGALAAIVYNTEKGPFRGTLGTPTGDEVATLSISLEDAEPYLAALAKGKHLETTVYVDSYVVQIKTTNIVAETKQGDHANVVMLGGHSDSVAAGPGINDDGSGSISLLTVAKALTNFKVKNAVRFAWWAAEEEGLLGSDHYVSQLTETENQKIRLFMDYDMMASPNYAYQVYDANNLANPNGSEELKNLYIDWYVEHGLNYTLIPFDGRSDYDAFIKGGIPGGGIATGAEAVKTKKEQAMFGGKAGEWLDQCYHQLCDDLDNVNYDAWVVNTKLIAHSVATYAGSFDGFPQRKDAAVSAVVPPFKYHGNKLIM
ncbi:hypothetical protein BABINDRAFT_162160 [Babjeviella inositovora NRRL Y-12698]|uniref:Peptide hydrolase n=1 Tax=Babjeviella inositovora NRRL Y-12698 TaxID=984486 RepID=A0A1E3QN27_9ASCO|nr:uncharacterized protein BABINDRAFT_162160 [Babjeviella inositovora NRRL Y-12698]ODQ79095.1 hypothetical protein BABINDRAFT_162160 [Babjeviella inositovora NRRL Y-12698]